MKIGASFDPVTESEICALKKLFREKKLKDLYVGVSGEGVLSLSKREKLLKRALLPYRHLHFSSEGGCDILLDSFFEEEKKVREGSFRKAAYGTQKILFEEGDYLAAVAEARCSKHRAIHSVGVAETAKMLAHHWHLNEDIAYRAGMLHDITKGMSDEDGRKILSVWKPEWLSISPKIWHSYTAVIYLKQEAGLYDHRILNAIEHHTIGDGGSMYDDILYIADKTEPNRGYDSSAELKLACNDLKAAVKMIKKEAEEYRKKENANV